MRRYFFDVDDRGRRVRDALGFALLDAHRAMQEANIIVYQLAHAAKSEARKGTVMVTVRDDRGACIYESSTSVACD